MSEFFGGGKRGLSRIDSHLQSRFGGTLSPSGEEVADLALAAGDDLAIGGIVDGIGDLSQDGVGLLAEVSEERIASAFGRGFHPETAVAERDGPTLNARKASRQRNLPDPIQISRSTR